MSKGKTVCDKIAPAMFLLNFSHPTTEAQRAQIKAQIGGCCDRASQKSI